MYVKRMYEISQSEVVLGTRAQNDVTVEGKLGRGEHSYTPLPPILADFLGDKILLLACSRRRLKGD